MIFTHENMTYHVGLKAEHQNCKEGAGRAESGAFQLVGPSACMGKRNVKVLPWPWVEVTLIEPPMASASCSAMARPRPAPA